MSQDPHLRKLEISNTTRRRALGIYEIAGGVMGLIMVSTIIFNAFESILTSAVICFIILLYLFSILCGIFLLQNKEIGLQLSLLQQALQVVSIDLGSFAWTYIAGVGFSAGVELDEFTMSNIRLGISSFSVTVVGEGGFGRFMINLVALLLVFYIIQLRKNIQKENILRSTEQIADQLIS